MSYLHYNVSYLHYNVSYLHYKGNKIFTVMAVVTVTDVITIVMTMTTTVVMVLNKGWTATPTRRYPKASRINAARVKEPPTCPQQQPFIVSANISTHQKNLVINPQTDRQEVNRFFRWKALQLSASVCPHVTFQLGTCSHENEEVRLITLLTVLRHRWEEQNRA